MWKRDLPGWLSVFDMCLWDDPALVKRSHQSITAVVFGRQTLVECTLDESHLYTRRKDVRSFQAKCCSMLGTFEDPRVCVYACV